ncbi:hypothetical protein CICLE_v10003431mg [Citrus x clementina]|uniref:Ubiquitin-like protease family profile domain-containing protein n=1 Tax=Citrus clementina TaxID=85681 RepID=V4T0F7_CITCL|nr:hypothetical protein CICLE_v10003431mg [Citrus x clementina]
MGTILVLYCQCNKPRTSLSLMLFVMCALFGWLMAPIQPGSYECGYYVMLYMRDIIADASLQLNNFNGKAIYTQEKIDEVQYEWVDYV